LFDLGDQFHGHIERARATLGLEGQVPARLRAAWPLEGRKAAFDEGAELSDLAQGRLTRMGVPVGRDRLGVHGVVRRERGWEISTLIPGGFFEGLANQLADLFFQGAVMGDAPLAFAGFLGGEGLGGAFSLQEAGPAVIGTVEPGRFGFAGAVGFAAGAAGGGEAAGQQREGDVEGDGFCCRSALFCLHVS